MRFCPAPEGKPRDGERSPRAKSHSSEDPAEEDLASSVPKHPRRGTPERGREKLHPSPPPEDSRENLPTANSMRRRPRDSSRWRNPEG